MYALGQKPTWEELRQDQKEIFYKHARALPQELTAELELFIDTIEKIVAEKDLKGG